MKSFLFFLLIFLKIGYAKAQEIAVDRHFEHLLMGNRVEIFEDKSKKLGFEEVKNQKFEAYKKSSINFGFTNSYYWLHFRLKNVDSFSNNLFLEISNPHINKLQLFAVNGKDTTKSMLMGDHFPFAQRPYNHAHFVFPITLNAKENVEFFLWIDKHGEQLQIPIDLWAAKDFSEYNDKLHFFVVLFARKFFNIQQKNRYLDIHTKILLILLGAVFITFFSQNPALGLFKNYWYNPVFYEGNDLMFVMKITYFVALLALWSIIGIGIYLFIKTRKVENLWFTLSFSILLISGTLVAFIFLGYIPDNYFTQNIPLVLNPLEIIILSFLLANRYKNIYADNAKISFELAEQRQKNAIQLLEGQMIERRRLSQELHDGISLILANIRLRLSMLSEKFQSKELDDLVEKLGDVGQDVRQFSHALSPVLLEKNGLIDAIEELIATTQSNQIKLKIEFLYDKIDENNLNSLLKQTIYQIILELLNNTIRHANATEMQVYLHENKNHLYLEVSDNGVGYELLHKQKGIGLQNIKARTQSLYGKFQIKRQGIGMKHLVEIPIQTNSFS